jgi:hypothetical protein
MPGRVLVRFTGGIGRMLDTKRFLKRIVLVGLISTLPGYVSLSLPTVAVMVQEDRPDQAVEAPQAAQAAVVIPRAVVIPQPA